MATNDPLKSVENIVQLQSVRRTLSLPALQVPRTQPTPPVPFRSWVAVRDRAAAALLGGAKRLLLTGPAGTGKTILIEHVARVLRAAGRTVIIQLADADPEPPGPGVTLFVDEADRLSATKLRQLFDEAAGSVVLTGLAPLTRRVAAGTLQLTLEPLGQTEAREYIAQWLTLNGRTPSELDGKAVRALVELSGGVPRLLSTLLAAGSWLANSSDAPIIEAVHIHEAAELRSVLGPPSAANNVVAATPPAGRRRVLWSTLLTTVVLLGAAAAIVPRLFPAETGRAIVLATPFVQQAEQWLRGKQGAPPPSRPLETPVLTPLPNPVQSPVPTPVEAAAPPVIPTPIEAAPEPAAVPEPIQPAAEMPLATPTPTPEPIQAAPEAPKPEPAQKAPDPMPPEPPQSVLAPQIEAPHEAALPTVPAAPPVVAPPPNLPIETVEFLLRRGREMLAFNDLSAARLLFMRAAEGGSAEAMFDLGQTYDPAFLTSIGAARLSDRAEALRWYRRAAEHGNRAAEKLLPRP